AALAAALRSAVPPPAPARALGPLRALVGATRHRSRAHRSGADGRTSSPSRSRARALAPSRSSRPRVGRDAAGLEDVAGAGGIRRRRGQRRPRRGARLEHARALGPDIRGRDPPEAPATRAVVGSSGLVHLVGWNPPRP